MTGSDVRLNDFSDGEADNMDLITNTCSSTPEKIVTVILDEICNNVVSLCCARDENILNKMKLQRSFSCDYDYNQSVESLDDLLRGYEESRDPNEITCLIKGCDCEIRRKHSGNINKSRVEAINYNCLQNVDVGPKKLRRNSVQFLDLSDSIDDECDTNYDDNKKQRRNSMQLPQVSGFIDDVNEDKHNYDENKIRRYNSMQFLDIISDTDVVRTDTSNRNLDIGNISTASYTASIDKKSSNITTDTANISTTNISADTATSSDTANVKTDIANITTYTNINRDTANISAEIATINKDAEIIRTGNASTGTEKTNISTKTVNLSRDTANIRTDFANITRNTGNISRDSANITAYTAYNKPDITNISTDSANISPYTANISKDAANIITETTNIIRDSANIRTEIENISKDTTCISTETADVTSNIRTNSHDSKHSDYEKLNHYEKNNILKLSFLRSNSTDTPDGISNISIGNTNTENIITSDNNIKQRRNSVQFLTSSDSLDIETSQPEENKKLRRNSVQFLDEEIVIDNTDDEMKCSDTSDDFEDITSTKSRRDSLYSLKEYDEDLDENENSSKSKSKYVEDEKKRTGFLKSLFIGRKSKVETENLKNSQRKGRKYSSAIDISSRPLKRSSSFLKKKFNSSISEGAEFLKRSLSFRNINEKRELGKSREKLSEMKNLEWAQSLQSLVENDNTVSYKDLSFVNYDQLNLYSYKDAEADKKKNGKIWRTQSMLVNGSVDARQTPKLTRGTSIAGVSFEISETNHATDITEHSGAVSLPTLNHLNQENADVSLESSPTHRYRRRPQSVNSEDGRQRPYANGSFRSAGSACSKLKRHNACRQKSRTSGGSTSPKSLQDDSIAREATVEETDVSEQQEWRRLVGSIRRRVQRHASGSGEAPTTTPVRKNSLTQASRFDFFRREKSREEPLETRTLEKHEKKEVQKAPVTKQKSCEPNPLKSKGLKAKSEIKMTVDKPPRLGSFRKGKKEEKCINKDDFLQATMRIFLVVSPPVGKMQVRSRSLNHLDTLEMRQGVPTPSDTALKDARSEPDCTRPLLAPPVNTAPCESTSPSRPEPPHRRHMLSRSQKSSSECFSVNFEVGADESTFDTELFFPAIRGITLNESLSKQCELRNIDLSTCDAWLADREGNTQSWLSLSQDTACLVGKHVRITHKDGSNRNKLGSLHGGHSRKLSGNFRPRTGGFFSSSTEDASAANLAWQQEPKASQDFEYKKLTKQRWSGLFGNNKDTKQSMEQLIEQLNNYSKFGVPTCQVYPIGQSESTDALYKLEDDWRDIINVSELTERQQKQQTALWELIKTELAYIKTLKVVTDLFLACLRNLQTSNILKEIDTSKLFSNINDILDANVQFWRNSLFPLVRDMRTYKQPPCIETMCEGFRKIKDSFQAYYRFCGEQARCQHYCRENLAHNDLFTAYLAWCETQKECNRLRLMDILVQPMQRLTKYGLLLKAILKNTDDEVERDNLNLMIRSVDDFVNNVNSSLKQKQDNERLKGIIARIESYDIVETKDDDLEKILRSYNQLDLNKSMLNCPPERKRHLLLEGDLKFKDSNTSKMEVHCFLLTDMLLICKSSTKKGGATVRVIRQPYLVDRLVVTEVNKETPTLACVYKNEFDMAVAAFLLQNNDAKKLKSWKDGIAKAQNLYAQAKQSYIPEESIDNEYSFEYSFENEFHCLQLAPRSPLATSSRASRVSSLAHSHSGSVEMNDQSSIGSAKEPSRAVSVENENRTASISSDEGVQPLPPDKSPVSQKNSFKHRLFNKTPNTLSVQPYTHGLGQSLPNLALGSPNMGTLNLNLNQNTLSVPSTSKNGHLLSPTHRGISYPPPSPTRGNLRRGLAITQNKNPPLIKTRHVNSTGSCTAGPIPASFELDVPVIAGVSSTDQCENFSRGQHRQAMLKRHRNDNKRYHTAGVVDDIKKNNAKDASIHKRLSWNCSSQEPQHHPEDQT